MMSIEYSNKCPECGDNNVMRIRRKWWMKIFNDSKLYYCPHCHKKMLLVGQRVVWTTSIKNSTPAEEP